MITHKFILIFFLGQFKSAKEFNWLATQHVRWNVKFLWNFFKSGHGKGEHDGAGAYVKHALCQNELSGIIYCYVLINFDVYDHLLDNSFIFC